MNEKNWFRFKKKIIKSLAKWLKNEIKNFSVLDLIQWIHWWFSQKIQMIKMSDIFRKFLNILNGSVDKFDWICGWIPMNSLLKFNEFVNEF